MAITLLDYNPVGALAQIAHSVREWRDPSGEHGHRAVGGVDVHDFEVGAGAEDGQHVGGARCSSPHT